MIKNINYNFLSQHLFYYTKIENAYLKSSNYLRKRNYLLFIDRTWF